MRTRMYGGVRGRKTKVGGKSTFVFLLLDFLKVALSQPLSLRDIPFQGNAEHSLCSVRVPSLLRLSQKVSLTRVARR